VGDDCAVLRIPMGHEMLVTTDFSLEGTHFRREWHPPESVGHRCLARGLSDIAAMGGEPVAAFLSLGLPPKLPQGWVDGFFKGLLNLAKQFGVTLAGGDTAQSLGGVLADTVVVGSAPKGRALLRSHARPGDGIYVTGHLGGSAAALNLLYSGERKQLNPDLFPAHFFPQPRVPAGIFLREKNIASAMIDISDGLSTDLNHLCEESKVGAEVFESAVPSALIGKPPREVGLDFALHGGDDYELLFTARAGVQVLAKIGGVPVTRIGRISAGSGIVLVNAAGKKRKLQPRGWEHFRS
jgi:thiamine-monophosphate kinase